MWIYLAFLAVVVLIGIPLCRNKTGKIIYCVAAGIILFVFAAIRKYTGYDYNLYAQVYIDFLSMDLDQIGVYRFEKGIAMPMKLLGNVMYVDYQWMFVGYALIFAAALMVILYKTSDKPYLGVFFYMTFGMYYISLDFMRQMVASFIVVLGMRYIKTNQFFRYLLVVLFASCFHYSALVMIPFFFLLRIKMNAVTFGVYTGTGILMFIFSWPLIQFLTKTFLPKYYHSGDVPRGEMDGNYLYIYTVFYGIFIILAFLFRKRLQAKDPDNRIWIGCMFFGFFFDAISLKHNIVGRLAIPFLIAASAILMPRVVECMFEWYKEKFKGNKKRSIAFSAVSLACIGVICVGMYGYMAATNYNGVNPYQTVFDDTPWVDPRDVWGKDVK